MPKLRVPDISARLAEASWAAAGAAEAEVRRFAADLKNRFVDRIRRQDFQSFRRIPLSWRWQLYKRRNHLDDRTMIATGAYLRSIATFETKTKTGFNIRIGIHPSVWVRHPVTGARKSTPMWRLACVHEFGSSRAHTPARPHWGPFFMEVALIEAPVEARRMVQAVGRKVAEVVR